MASPRRWLGATAILAVVLAWALTAWQAPGLLDRLRENEGLVPPGLFLAILALLPAVGLPISLAYAAAGVLFPLPLALGLLWTGLALNLALSYVLGGRLLRGPTTRLLERRGIALPTLTRVNQFRLTYLVRAVPGVPFMLQNYLLAVLEIPFRLYFPISLGVQGAIGTAVALIAGGALDRQPSLIIAGGIALFLLGWLGSTLIRRWEPERRALASLRPE